MKYEPGWKQYEKDLHSDDADTARKAGIAFDEARNHELKNSTTSRNWEESRKEEWAKEKPQWKQQQLKQEQANLDRINQQLREGGHLMKGLIPRAGLLIVKPEKQESEDSGIYIPDSVQYLSNTARVVRVSEAVKSTTGNIECPCKVGDLVMVRDGSGLDLKINKEHHLLIRFDEVFGVVEE